MTGTGEIIDGKPPHPRRHGRPGRPGGRRPPAQGADRDLLRPSLRDPRRARHRAARQRADRGERVSRRWPCGPGAHQRHASHAPVTGYDRPPGGQVRTDAKRPGTSAVPYHAQRTGARGWRRPHGPPERTNGHGWRTRLDAHAGRVGGHDLLHRPGNNRAAPGTGSGSAGARAGAGGRPSRVPAVPRDRGGGAGWGAGSGARHRGAREWGRSGQAEGAGIGNPRPPPGTGATRMDLASRSRARLMLPALPFAIIAANGVSRVVMGPGWGMLLVLAVGPAVAAAVGGPLYTLAAGAAALAVGLPFAGRMRA